MLTLGLIILIPGPRLIDISAWHRLNFSNLALTDHGHKGESVDACRVLLVFKRVGDHVSSLSKQLHAYGH